MIHPKKLAVSATIVLAAVAGGAVTFVGSKAAKHRDDTSHRLELLDQTSRAFHDVAQRTTPAVVSISVVKRADDLSQLLGISPGGGMPGAGRGGDAGGLPPGAPPDLGGPMDPSGKSVGLGSGVIIRPDGYIVTNNHVVEGSEKITVMMGENEKKKFSAHVVGTDPKTDLAVIRIDRTAKDGVAPLPTMDFGDSSDIRVGDWAVAIGSPFGLNRSVSSGIISAKGRAQMGILDVEDFIQTDAAINPGSSGGPLLNAQGELIGINTAIFTQGGGFMGIGFAIPAEIAREVTRDLIAKGYVTRGWIGLSAQDVDDDLAKYFSVPRSQGALVSNVQPGGPGAKAELEAGDVVLSYDQHKIDNAGEFKNLVGRTAIGKKVSVDVLRSGKPMNFQVTILQQPGADQPPLPTNQMAGRAARGQQGLGLQVEDVPDEIVHFLGMEPGHGSGAIVVEVQPGSPAFDSGLSPGDIILKVGSKEVDGAKELKKLTGKFGPGDLAVFYVQRGPKERIFVPVKNEA